MIKFIETENSVFEVDTVAKTVTRIHGGDNPHWTDKVKAPFEFMQHLVGGELYFHAFDPETGNLRPFVTSRVKVGRHHGY